MEEIIGIKAKLNNLHYLILTAEQISKDFGFEAHSIALTGLEHSAYEELYQQVLPLVSQMIDKNFSSFCQVLYRVDISETKARKLMQQSDDFYSAITHSIIKRELQKVVLRAHFNRPSEGEAHAPAFE